MLRVIVAILTVGLLLTVLASTANSAPGRRGGGRTAGAATRAGNAAQNVAPGRNSAPAGQRAAAANLGAVRPTGPINTTPPQAGGPRFPGLQNGSLNVPSQLPGASQLPQRNPGQWQGHLPGQLSNSQAALEGRIGEAAATYGINPNGPAPFSPAWYAQHPNAWQITHPYAGEAVAAVTAVGLASFMAMEAATASGGTTTIVYGSEATAQQTQTAAELAQSGDGQVDSGGPWMPIGAFAFRPMDAPNATRMIQLSVNSQGILRGAHYDLLSEETADILGAVDRNTGRVSWRIGDSGQVIFETTLAQLTQPQGQVVVHFPDGQTGHWTVTQMHQ